MSWYLPSSPSIHWLLTARYLYIGLAQNTLISRGVLTFMCISLTYIPMPFPITLNSGTLRCSPIFNLATRALTLGGFTCKVEPFEVGALVLTNQPCTL